MMPPGSSAVSLTYLALECVVPGYGGGMSSAKAQLESDTKVSKLCKCFCFCFFLFVVQPRWLHLFNLCV